jgi:7-carboxy-7-deazaguanine synthase
MTEAFTNGTIMWTALATDTVAMVMDWKLPGSGEVSNNANRTENFLGMTWGDSVKFTIKDKTDYETARRIYDIWKDKNEKVEWFFGAVWDTVDYDELINWVLEDGLPWRFNMQVHNHVWDRTQRGI